MLEEVREKERGVIEGRQKEGEEVGRGEKEWKKEKEERGKEEEEEGKEKKEKEKKERTEERRGDGW